MTTKTLPEIDADLRRVVASLEGARAAHRRCPNGENAERVAALVAFLDGMLEHRYERQVDETVSA